MLFGRWRFASLARVSSFLAALFFAAVAMPAFAAELRVLADLDNNSATGCTVTTPAGALTGVEQRFITTVDTTVDPPRVTGVTREDCTGGAFGAPVSVSSGGWNVGLGNGTNGDNVIETSLPVPSGTRVIRLGFIYDDPAIGADGLIATTSGSPILVAALTLTEPFQVPTLSSVMLALLVVLM